MQDIPIKCGIRSLFDWSDGQIYKRITEIQTGRGQY